ncbi:MAG: DUF4387 domain-containing protein [Burkholderiales bacterium]
MAAIKLGELATTVRSKNAGVNQITFDIIFRTSADYERARKSGALTRVTVARLFNVLPERISDFVEFDVANAIKFTLYRSRPGGSPGDWDMLGCQQYGPLLDVEIP